MVSLEAMAAVLPPMSRAQELDSDHMASIVATKAAGDRRLTTAKPTGDTRSSPVVCSR